MIKYCYEKGFYWDGLYEHFDRLSCWGCPLKNLKELLAYIQHSFKNEDAKKFVDMFRQADIPGIEV